MSLADPFSLEGQLLGFFLGLAHDGVVDFWVFELEMLGKGALTAVGLLAALSLAAVQPLDFVGTPAFPSFLLLVMSCGFVLTFGCNQSLIDIQFVCDGYPFLSKLINLLDG